MAGAIKPLEEQWSVVWRRAGPEARGGAFCPDRESAFSDARTFFDGREPGAEVRVCRSVLVPLRPGSRELAWRLADMWALDAAGAPVRVTRGGEAVDA